MRILLLPIITSFIACSSDDSHPVRLFTDVVQESGITFRNQLIFTEEINPYTYRNFYNGAGVAVGDINNDGLLDIYFAGNQVDNKLYLNQGDFMFKDITEAAGVACADVWSSGVTFVDINADGYLDLYVCKSGSPNAPHRNNELFINNGDMTFTEKSREYGLDITGLSVQAAFFDFDKDGDLDCYLLTNSIRSVGNYDLVKGQRNTPDPQGGGNKFFLNNNGKFVDFSAEAGIYRSNIGFGLGITLGDFNNDSWTDIFVSNDFFERDYLYINNQKGSFVESLTDYFPSISMGSMGADLADLDNDGTPELFVTEMLPDSLNRKKSKTVYENWDKHQLNVQNEYHEQFSRNVLQKKISDNKYAEIGRLAGVAASEWSWGALLFDMDNDGLRDIFIANGIYKDLLDRDYLTYTAAADNVKKIIRQEERNAILKLIDLMPSSSFPNYAYHNEGNLKFTNMAPEWGLGEPMYSSGSAYGDFDNDGDLDLVVNNINALPALYRNNSDSLKHQSITLSLSSKSNNTFEVGSQITIYCGSGIYVADNFVTRGFQSSVQPLMTVGLGEGVRSIDSVAIRWSDGGHSKLYNLSTNRRIDVKKEESELVYGIDMPNANNDFHLKPLSRKAFVHKASGLVDFNRDRMLPMMYSNETPAMMKGDIDGDGTEDVIVGGGRNQQGVIVQFKKGKVDFHSPEAMMKYSVSEETKGALLDVDNDGDLDIYMANGGRFFPKSSSALVDKIFLNDGKGNFSESPHPLPFADFISTSAVKAIDFDNDGDADLVVGERFDPFVYGIGGRAYLLENDGTGKFRDVTKQFSVGLSSVGMVTDIEVQDINNDGWQDIVIVGDWMPIVVFQNNQKNFVNISGELGLSDTEGWWHTVVSADFNKDGRIDFVVGNHGLNTFFKSGDRMYVNDFDGNGSVEQIFCTLDNGKYYPVVEKDEFLSQLPSYKKELLYYKTYGKKSIDELFPPAVLTKSKVLEVKMLTSVFLLSDNTGYKKVVLPQEAQYSPIYGFATADFDNDGIVDVIAGGNQYEVKPQFGRYDASNGWFFKGSLNQGEFKFEKGKDLNVKGQIRDIEYVHDNGVTYILFAKYDDELEIFEIPD